MNVTEIPQFPDFVPLSLSHKPIVDGLNLRLDNNAAVTNFTNIFMLDAENKTSLSSVGENMVIDFGDGGGAWLGDGDGMGAFVQNNHHWKGVLVSLDPLDKNVKSNPDEAEYLYLIQNMRKNDGKLYEGIRRKINQFKSLGEGVVEFYRMGDLDRIWRISKDWYDEEKDEQAYSRSFELIALEKTLNFCDELNLEINCLRLGGSLIGYTIIEQIAKKTVLVHFFKTQRDVAGAAEFLFWSIADKYANKNDLINFEQDLGVEGLRRFKESLRPIDKINVYQNEL